MSHHKLFIANLPQDVTEDQLRAVCEQYGPVHYLRLFIHNKTGKPMGKARLTYQTDAPVEPILAALNAYRWGEQRMRVSPNAPHDDPRELTGEQQTLVQQVVTQLNEEAPGAIAIIERLVQLCGEAFAQGLLDDTLQIEAAGGLWLAKRNRRRTPGGVYLFLAREAVSYPMRQVLFPLLYPKKKKKSAQSVSPAATPPVDKTIKNGQAEAKQAKVLVEDGPVSEPPDQPIEDTPQPDLSEPVISRADETPSIQQQLATLQRAHQEAQDVLVAVKAGQAQVSPMVAMKTIVDTKRALDEFLRQHPELG